MLIADFIPRLTVDAPECPDETARQAIVDAARELCKDSFAWAVTLDPVSLIDGIADYDIETPTDAQPAGVLRAWLPTREIMPRNMSQIAALMPGWQTAESPEPLYFNSPVSGASIRVYPTPMNANRVQMTMRVAFAPTRDATELDDDLVGEWDEAILQGARARLFKQPRKPWSNRQAAIDENDLFLVSKNDARVQALHDSVTGTITVQPRPFGL